MNQTERASCGAEMTEPLYRFTWGNNAKRALLKGRICRVLARGKMNTVMVEFIDNGERVTVSRRALRKTRIDLDADTMRKL